MFACVLVVILVQQVCYAVDDLYCSQAFACANQSTVTNQSSTTLYNYGYKSHYGFLASMTTQYRIKCLGSHSCTKASSISSPYVHCDGANSCSKSSNIALDASRGLAAAHGVNALIYTTISASTRSITCYGEQSCAYSVIKGSNSIKGWGAYSLLNASIDSINGPTSIVIDFFGYYSGFGSVITCRTEHICTIHCASNACINVHLNCNGNCIIEKQSTATMVSNYSLLDIQDVLLYDSFIISQQNDAACSAQHDTMHFDDYRKGYQTAEIIGNATIGGPLCCTGYQSCYEANNIINALTTKDSVVCSGSYSCRASANIYTNGAVYCGGQYSCGFSSIITREIVFCGASYSCYYANINKASEMYCSGYYSCYSASISSDGSDLNLYLLGSKSAHSANVSCIASDRCVIFCYGYDSCKNVQLLCDGECTVYCDTDSLCPDGWTATATQYPTNKPITAPTQAVTQHPTNKPTTTPTQHPITAAPTQYVTNKPSIIPTSHTQYVTNNPTQHPITAAPTQAVTQHPTQYPITAAPTQYVTNKPSINPTSHTQYVTKKQTRIVTTKPETSGFTATDNNQFFETISITLVINGSLSSDEVINTVITYLIAKGIDYPLDTDIIQRGQIVIAVLEISSELDGDVIDSKEIERVLNAEYDGKVRVKDISVSVDSDHENNNKKANKWGDIIYIVIIVSLIVICGIISIGYLCWNKKRKEKRVYKDTTKNMQMTQHEDKKENRGIPITHTTKGELEHDNIEDKNNTNTTLGETEGNDDIEDGDDSRSEGANIQKRNNKFIYNMDASGDEIVIGNDEVTLGGNTKTSGDDTLIV